MDLLHFFINIPRRLQLWLRTTSSFVHGGRGLHRWACRCQPLKPPQLTLEDGCSNLQPPSAFSARETISRLPVTVDRQRILRRQIRTHRHRVVNSLVSGPKFVTQDPLCNLVSFPELVDSTHRYIVSSFTYIAFIL